MDTLDKPVTLVIKSPNQTVKDVKIECSLQWSILQLKQHLSDAYPGKPKITDQKIIYSGRLLNDKEMLKDILRYTYEAGQITHTVHLLCVSKPNVSAKQSSQQSSSSTSSSSISSSEGLRHRHPHPATQEPSQASQAHQNTQYYGASPGLQHGAAELPMPAMLPGVPYSPEQMMWFQQVYAQQMAQYMQYMQQGHAAAVTTGVMTSQHDAAAHHAPAQAPAAGVAAGNGGGAVGVGGAARDQQMVMNAAGGQAMFDDDEEANRDWLDLSYMVCRFGVLLMIVYFYSSVARFLVVFGFFILIWLYQAGYLRRRRPERLIDDVIEVQVPAAQEAENEAVDNQPEPEAESEENVDGDTERAEPTTEDTEEVPPPPGVARVAFSFFTTFFTSLVPAPPEAVHAN